MTSQVMGTQRETFPLCENEYYVSDVCYLVGEYSSTVVTEFNYKIALEIGIKTLGRLSQAHGQKRVSYQICGL